MEEQQKTTNKLTDKAFSRLAFTSILGILVCIVCLCSSTYAWFSESQESPKNEIKTAEECLISVTVLHEDRAENDSSEPDLAQELDLEFDDGNVTVTETPIAGIEDGVELAAGEYLVKMTLPSGSASGYYLVEASGTTFYTDFIARHEEDEPQTVSFIMKVEETQWVKFISRWGIYSGESDVVDGVLVIPAQQTVTP